MTILFNIFFGRWMESEHSWYMNEYRQEKIRNREMKWLPITVFIDVVIAIIFIVS